MILTPLLAAALAAHAAPAAAPKLTLTPVSTVPIGLMNFRLFKKAESADDALVIWDLMSGKPTSRIEAPELRKAAPNDYYEIKPLAYSHDGRRLLAAVNYRPMEADGYWHRGVSQLFLVDMEEERLIQSIASVEGGCTKEVGITTRCSEYTHGHFAPDGRFAVSRQTAKWGSPAIGKEITLYSADGKELRREANNRFTAEFLGYDSEGRVVGLAKNSSSCALMELEPRKRLTFLDDCNEKAVVGESLEYGMLIEYFPHASPLRIWDARTGAAYKIPFTEKIAVSADGGYAVTWRIERPGMARIDFIDAATSRIVASTSSAFLADVYAYYPMPDGRHLGYLSSSLQMKMGILRVDGVKLPTRAPIRAPGKPSGMAAAAPDSPKPAPFDADRPPASAVASEPDAYAVVIGVEKYRQPGVPKVDYAARDAQTVHAYLTGAMGFDPSNIALLVDEQATKTDLEKNLGKWLKNRVGPKSRVFVYYAGHGAPNPTTGEGYLMPYEADPSYLEETAYPVARLYAELEKLPTRDVAVVLDACFSGQGQRSLIAKGTRPLVQVQTTKGPANAAVIAAATGSQISASDHASKHGLLTYHLLSGLHGPADADGDGAITAAEAFAYARPAVERAAKLQNVEQTPTVMGGDGPAARRVWVSAKKK